MKPIDLKIFVERGCVSEVWASKQRHGEAFRVAVDVVDLDGDYQIEGERLQKRLEKSAEKMRCKFEQVWP